MIVWAECSPLSRQQLLARPAIAQSLSLADSVASIINDVATNGDQALFALTEKFDAIKLTSLTVGQAEIDAAVNRLSSMRKQAIDTAYHNIDTFHSAQQFNSVTVETSPGVTCSLMSEALSAVGLYIPAGSAPLPSTVLMLGVPAQIAGCPRVVLCCPPDKSGQLSDETLYAAQRCGINEIYRIGGAQAIAAMALGTETISPVNKVFGPGNKFVTEAKKQLAQQVPGFAIDMPAGPSEVLVIADEFANAEFVAADLLSQAEHGPDSQVILLTESATLISQVETALSNQLATLSRANIAKQALSHSRLILTESIEQAVEVANQYGPEHLIINTKNAAEWVTKIRNAGSVFVGAYTPESAGDYASGTNHVLPTYGYSKVVSSLTLADFSRRFTVQQISRDGLAQLAPTLIELTNAEGLDGHQRAVTIRLEA